MKKLRLELIKYAKKLNIKNLTALRSGNISIRSKQKNIEGFLITPSGVKYSSLEPKDIVFVTLKGKFDKKKGIPSSEWKFHQDIYLKKKMAQAVVHVHSTCATAISSFGKAIPAFHYMVALAGGNDIKCATYSTFGTRQLSKNIMKALKNRLACLIGNHGQVTFGKSLPSAFELAEEVENLSHQYINALRIGIPKILSKKEIERVLLKIKNYKKE